MSNFKLSVDLLGLENVKKAYAIANNAIYFDDGSDYLTALYAICKLLNPQVNNDQIGSSFIDNE
ncbi:MAG: hypothetical protein ACLSH8_16545 [Zhenhengia sp.]|uniref:hypothetical protein n=1 Tax=Zhenhengia sp. TaxID=2944208 RepID=UPI003990EBDA